MKSLESDYQIPPDGLETDTGRGANELPVGMAHLMTKASRETVIVDHFLSIIPVGSTLTLNMEGLRRSMGGELRAPMSPYSAFVKIRKRLPLPVAAGAWVGGKVALL